MRSSRIWGIIKAEVCVICRSRRLRQITQTEALIIPYILREPNSIIVLLFISICEPFLQRSHLYFEFWHKQHKAFVFCIWHKQHKTRNCVNPNLMLKVPLCKTNTFQSSFLIASYTFGTLCVELLMQPSDLRSLTMFRSFLSRTYLKLLISCYDVDMTCTWSKYH